MHLIKHRPIEQIVGQCMLIRKLNTGDYSRETLTQALAFRGPAQRQLFALARQRREEHFPSRAVQMRSVIEISNICHQRCNFCSIGRIGQSHYVITHAEFLALADHIYNKKRRVLLIQSGENDSKTFVNHVCGCLKALTPRHRDLKIILCLGNMKTAQYRQLHAAGAAWYILKFETSNAKLYRKLKPRDTLAHRLGCIASLLRAGFEVGSGNMVGLPGQTTDDLVNDLYLLGKYKLVTQSCSVFIPGEKTKCAAAPMGDLDLTLNMMALMRIMYPDRMIPTTSSLEKARRGGQYLGLMAGANTVTVHDGTPAHFKRLFPIYSTKRITPQDDYLRSIVRKAGLKLASGAEL
ncbi:MAG: radical SAM protein [Kiritimatiellae bacterium]|nr:radical SAM protein [Kiritimatiellia bacterium]